MMYIKIQGHRPFGSREEDFLGFYHGHGGHLGHVTRTI